MSASFVAFVPGPTSIPKAAKPDANIGKFYTINIDQSGPFQLGDEISGKIVLSSSAGISAFRDRYSSLKIELSGYTTFTSKAGVSTNHYFLAAVPLEISCSGNESEHPFTLIIPSNLTCRCPKNEEGMTLPSWKPYITFDRAQEGVIYELKVSGVRKSFFKANDHLSVWLEFEGNRKLENHELGKVADATRAFTTQYQDNLGRSLKGEVKISTHPLTSASISFTISFVTLNPADSVLLSSFYPALVVKLFKISWCKLLTDKDLNDGKGPNKPWSFQQVRRIRVCENLRRDSSTPNTWHGSIPLSGLKTVLGCGIKIEHYIFLSVDSDKIKSFDTNPGLLDFSNTAQSTGTITTVDPVLAATVDFGFREPPEVFYPKLWVKVTCPSDSYRFEDERRLQENQEQLPIYLEEA